MEKDSVLILSGGVDSVTLLYDDAGDSQRPELPQSLVLWQILQRSLGYDTHGISDEISQKK